MYAHLEEKDPDLDESTAGGQRARWRPLPVLCRSNASRTGAVLTGKLGQYHPGILAPLAGAADGGDAEDTEARCLPCNGNA